MSSDNSGTNSRRGVALLREDVASKIAAGEVIDRPAAVLRELLDNAIDSGADRIELRIEDGGISLIQVEDNGAGMTAQDIELCWLSHATSKIRHEDDLSHITSLGFRGEALSSIAAVSRLEIVSRSEQEDVGNILAVHSGKQISLNPQAWSRGTRVTVEDLFYSLPVRRKFLSSPRGESGICRRICLEKAQAFPEISFVLHFGQQSITLPARTGEQALLQRFLDIHSDTYRAEFFSQLEGKAEGFSCKALIGSPAIFRRDRKHIQIFVNRRRIFEFSLQQAIEYGFQGFLPGGSYPVASVFVQINPSLVDFNIHPAKREARFRDLAAIRRRLSATVQDFLVKETGYRTRTGDTNPFLPPQPAFDLEPRLSPPPPPSLAPQGKQSDTAGFEARRFAEYRNDSRSLGHFAADSKVQRFGASEAQAPQSREFRYLGQLFSLFLLVELGERFLLVDMHAAHEKILYDELRQNPRIQELLIPLEIEEGIADKKDAERVALELSKMGFEASAEGSKLLVSAVPGMISKNESILVDFIRDSRGDFHDIDRALYASISCRSALMDGDSVSVSQAEEIIAKVLEMENPRCPHGRPIWFELSRSELFTKVGRTGTDACQPSREDSRGIR